MDIFIPRNHKNPAFSGKMPLPNISTTVHAMRKSFVPFCSAQDGESIDINCLVFWAHCENGKILTKHQVYNKGILPILPIFSGYEILISIECAVD